MGLSLGLFAIASPSGTLRLGAQIPPPDITLDYDEISAVTSLSFPTHRGVRYTLQRSTDLTDWQSLGTFYGTGQPLPLQIQEPPPGTPPGGFGTAVEVLSFSWSTFTDPAGLSLITLPDGQRVLASTPIGAPDPSLAPGFLIAMVPRPDEDPVAVVALRSDVPWSPTFEDSAFTPDPNDPLLALFFEALRPENLNPVLPTTGSSPPPGTGNAISYRIAWFFPDFDRDGIPDYLEYLMGSDPNNPDSDGDGVTDGDEITYGSNPGDPDSLPDPTDEAKRAAFEGDYQKGRITLTGDTSKLRVTPSGLDSEGEPAKGSRPWPAISGPGTVVRAFHRAWRYSFSLVLEAEGSGKSAELVLEPLDSDGESGGDVLWKWWAQIGPDPATVESGTPTSPASGPAVEVALEPVELTLDARRDGVLDHRDEVVTGGYPLETELAYDADGKLRDTGALVICHYDQDEGRQKSFNGFSQPAADLIYQANTGVLSDEDFVFGPGEEETVTLTVDGNQVQQTILRDIHPLRLTVPENLPPEARLFLVAPDGTGLPAGKAYRAFHLYKRVAKGETAIWGGFHSAAMPAPWTQGTFPGDHPDTVDNNQREVTHLLNANAPTYQETRPGALPSGPYEFGIEGLLYKDMKYRFEGEGAPLDDLHTFNGVVELRLELEISPGKRGVIDTVRWTQIRVPAFPGAEGAGKWALGGRYGDVYKVTSLADSGPGSLREGVVNRDMIQGTGCVRPRTIVFDVAGYIDLQSPIAIDEGFLTIAGQTAPGGGICLRNFGLENRASQVIVRYLRSRPGDQLLADDNPGTPIRDDLLKDLDAFTIWAGNNLIFDHCSATWGTDTAFDVAVRGDILSDRSLTVQWCLLGETLRWSFHPEDGDHLQPNHPSGIPVDLQLEDHSMGSAIIGFNGAAYSFHHNLYANCRHNTSRMPKLRNSERPTNENKWVFDFRNNVVYNWSPKPPGEDSFAGNLETKQNDGHTSYNFVDNYFKIAIGHAASDLYVFRNAHGLATPHFDGNELWYYSNGAAVQDDRPQSALHLEIENGTSPVAAENFVLEALGQTQSTTEAKADVVAHVGASSVRDPLSKVVRSIRDTTDSRIISDFNQGTDGTLDSQINPPAPDPYNRPATLIDRWTINRNWIPNFDREGTDGYAVLAGGTAGVDSDEDGLLDDWETSNFSADFPTDTLVNVRPESDPDHDGMTILDQFLTDCASQAP